MPLRKNRIDRTGKCFRQLMAECKSSHPGAQLSLKVRLQLEKFTGEIRREIVTTLNAGSSPLFIACKKGKVEIVEYLITFCNADIEQRGSYVVPHEGSIHIVTPLWCAAVAGRLSVVKCLLQYGANINAVSDTGSTPVRSACYMSNFDIVKVLYEMGADINQPNYNGGTCLINSVQSTSLCEFLLDNGADINASDVQGKTALHYAIQEQRLETTQLLVQRGADCFAKSRNGDDALQTACLKGAANIFTYLTGDALIHFTADQLANSYELMGATYLCDRNDAHEALSYWKKALVIRLAISGLLPKQPFMEPVAAYLYHTEYASVEDLERVPFDQDALKMQGLLISERILGSYHKEFISRLMFQGSSYIEARFFQRCIDLWKRALVIKVKKDSILHSDTCMSAQALVRIMFHYNLKHVSEVESGEQQFCNAFEVFKILIENIIEFRKLATTQPIYRKQVDNFDKILNCVAQLIYLMVITATTSSNICLVKTFSKELLQTNPTTINNNDTLLHLCVSKLHVISAGHAIELLSIWIPPHLKTIKFLLECGATVNAKNQEQRTALYYTANLLTFDKRIVKLLLDNGAHIDHPDALGETPLSKIIAINNELNSDIPVLKYLSLKCLCAQIIRKYKIEYNNQLPKDLEEFVKQHC